MKVLQPSQPGEWAVLTSSFPGCESEPIGIIIRDVTRDLLDVKVRENWWSKFQGNQEQELWSGLADDIRQQALEMGANEYLNWFETSCSHVLQMSSRRSLLFQDMAASLSALYEEEVEGNLRNSAAARAASERLRDTTVDEKCKFRLWAARLNEAWSNMWSARMFQHAALPTCVVAVTCLVAAVFAFAISSESQPESFVTMSKPTNVSSSIDFYQLPRQQKPLLLELDLPELSVIPANVQHRTKIHRRSHKAFAVQLPSPEIPAVQVARIERLTPPSIHLEAKAPSILVAAAFLPEPPKYHSRNKFIRLLSAIGKSFSDSPHPSTLIAPPR
jgi:hypothetical protein